MEWLKNKLDTGTYEELESTGVIDKLKKVLGETEYIPMDKGKWIEKSVFNAKLAEIKNLKETVENYKIEMDKRKDLITTDEYKLKELEMQKDFEAREKLKDENHKKEKDQLEKVNLLTNLYATSGCKDPKMLLNNTKFEDVLVKDGVIQNSKELVEGFKKSASYMFNDNPQSGVPNKGEGSNKSTKEQLIEQYNKMQPGAAKLSLQRQIQDIENK